MDENILQIATYFAQTKNPNKIYRFLEELLTPAEIKDVALRWRIVKMLQLGSSQRKIAAQLHVSLCKITRGSKELKKADSVFKEAIRRLETK